MSEHERTTLASVVCLALVVVGFTLFIAYFEWPTSRMVRGGHLLTGNDIIVHDVLPIVVAGYVIGLCAIAISRFFFPRSSIKVVLYVACACAAIVSLPFWALAVAISGTPTERDLGTIAMIWAVPLAIATWAVISAVVSWCRPGRAAD